MRTASELGNPDVAGRLEKIEDEFSDLPSARSGDLGQYLVVQFGVL